MDLKRSSNSIAAGTVAGVSENTVKSLPNIFTSLWDAISGFVFSTKRNTMSSVWVVRNTNRFIKTHSPMCLNDNQGEIILTRPFLIAESIMQVKMLPADKFLYSLT